MRLHWLGEVAVTVFQACPCMWVPKSCPKAQPGPKDVYYGIVVSATFFLKGSSL